MEHNKTTESESNYQDLEKMSTMDILSSINQEDKSVPFAVEKKLNAIAEIVPLIVERLENAGRLFYIGAGTSGRLGVVDASECPPTYGVPHDMVIALIAGGDSAIRKAVEFAEDDEEQGWKDLQEYKINKKDFLIGIAASGTTPYVIGAIKNAREKGIATACITCNENSPLAKVSQYPIEVDVGPEFVTGSTRMKAGTAQKLLLNMITTSVMIKLGKIKGNKMVDMQLSNNKLVTRGVKMLMEELNIGQREAEELLKKHGNVRKAILDYGKQ